MAYSIPQGNSDENRRQGSLVCLCREFQLLLLLFFGKHHDQMRDGRQCAAATDVLNIRVVKWGKLRMGKGFVFLTAG